MKQRIFNLLILDESGSMFSIKKQAVDSVNETLQSVRAAQKKYEDQEHLVSFVSFTSDGVKTLIDRKEAMVAEDITMEQYKPNCGTPLYDAIGKAVSNLRKSVAENDKVLVTIITDGYENASTEYNQHSIKAMTEELGKKGWTFAYIGANQDVKAVSDGLGIKNSMSFQSTAVGTMEMSAKLATSRMKWFSRVADNDAAEQENFFE